MFRRIWKFIGGSGAATAGVTAQVVDTSPPGPFGRNVVSRVIPRSKLDPDAVKIIQRLTRHENEAYLVGGCVRDLLLDRDPKDYDVGTSATPRQIKRLFRNCRIIGRRFRLAHIYFSGGKLIEVATFRASDRSPSEPDDEDLMIRDDNQFGTVEQDALRRDFTINQLFYDVNEQRVIDHTDGLGDLERRLIRTIGDPQIRFREDPIRILRAIKFAARLDFNIEAATQAALIETRSEIPKAAPPRVLEEINRFCRGGAGARSFELLRETKVFGVIFPEWDSAYRSDLAWSRLIPLLKALDAQTAEGVEVQTGSILAALMIPQLWSEFGWGQNGSVELPHGIKLRDIVDERLRALSLRLRISRKESERCRQLLATLTRMVPDDQLRPRSRSAIRRRSTLAETLVLLNALASSEGGEFAKAQTAWSSNRHQVTHGAPKRGPRERKPKDAVESAGNEETSAEPESPRRRRRRGGRGRGRTAESSTDPTAATKAQTPARSESNPSSRNGAKTQPETSQSKKPEHWDDDYFFSALPSVPAMEGDSNDSGDRYGAETLNRPKVEDSSKK